MGYRTVLGRYMEYRKLMAAYMERDFAAKRETIAYDEYLYLEPSKRRDKARIFDAHNFLTFHYDGKIYNILLPDLARFKPAMIEDGLEGVYYREFERFLRRSHIASSPDELIGRFWSYLEERLPRYRGISRQNFVYYLKEAEFLFNFGCEKLRSLVTAQPPRRGRR
jgi:transposase-like protein